MFAPESLPELVERTHRRCGEVRLATGTLFRPQSDSAFPDAPTCFPVMGCDETDFRRESRPQNCGTIVRKQFDNSYLRLIIRE